MIFVLPPWIAGQYLLYSGVMRSATRTDVSGPLENRLSRAAEFVREALSQVVNELPLRVQKPAEFQPEKLGMFERMRDRYIDKEGIEFARRAADGGPGR